MENCLPLLRDCSSCTRPGDMPSSSPTFCCCCMPTKAKRPKTSFMSWRANCSKTIDYALWVGRLSGFNGHAMLIANRCFGIVMFSAGMLDACSRAQLTEKRPPLCAFVGLSTTEAELAQMPPPPQYPSPPNLAPERCLFKRLSPAENGQRYLEIRLYMSHSRCIKNFTLRIPAVAHRHTWTSP